MFFFSNPFAPYLNVFRLAWHQNPLAFPYKMKNSCTSSDTNTGIEIMHFLRAKSKVNQYTMVGGEVGEARSDKSET